MSKIDAWTLVAYCVIVGPLVSCVISGPNLGLLGFILSFLVAILAWFVGTGLVLRFSGSAIRLDERFRKRMWLWCVVSSVGILMICVGYIAMVTNGRTSYSIGVVVLHFMVVFLTCCLVRLLTLSSSRAIESRAKADSHANEIASKRDSPVNSDAKRRRNR
jgi:drug/metabolite transporter (DMT)-like permease